MKEFFVLFDRDTSNERILIQAGEISSIRENGISTTISMKSGKDFNVNHSLDEVIHIITEEAEKLAEQKP